MKITRVEPILVALPYEHGGPKPMQAGGTWATMDTLFVRVETDAGIVGWGEAFGFAACPVTMAALTRVVGPLCIGKDPDDIAAVMAELGRKVHNMGGNGPLGFALSGIDIALWDIKGKVAGQPLYRLLGGAHRDQVPAYASLLRYGAADLVARNTEAALAQGYGRVKLHETAPETVAAARRAGGAALPLMVDTNCAWDRDAAVAMARRLAEFDLAWLEEPVAPPNDFDALAQVRRESGVTIAAGENLGNVIDAAVMAAKGAVDLTQPSVTKIGGVSALLKVIAMARGFSLKVAPHSPYFGPGLVATIHVIAALGEGMVCERFYVTLGASPLGDAVDATAGAMRVPQGPGLGVGVDERVLARYRVE
ncbi:MAG TPA: mandelate racemase/muconate lactonizing enzyme family protein [Stellaceae bacterium]|nr:mandelate racemase/muconate lactonizing enzyme family protein [Stellaceae bacterium]